MENIPFELLLNLFKSIVERDNNVLIAPFLFPIILLQLTSDRSVKDSDDNPKIAHVPFTDIKLFHDRF